MSRTFSDITPPQNNSLKIKGPRQKSTVVFGEQLRYEGELSNGQFDGFGIVSKDDQELYVGSFQNGLFHGQADFSGISGCCQAINFLLSIG